MSDNDHKEERYQDRIALSVTITAEGRNAELMINQAKVEAAAILGYSIDRLYVMGHTPLRVGSTTRFRAHLDEPTFVESWRIDVTIGVKPEGEE